MIGALPVLLVACFAPRATENPIPSSFYPGPAGSVGTRDQLVVFLPGRGDDIDAYRNGGFIEAMQQSYWPADAIVVDAHFGYYIERTLSERIYEDVLAPYRQRGYRRFLIVGVSLGGTGALRLREDFPGLISGVVLIAPFLGEEETIRMVEKVASLAEWRPEMESRAPLEPGEEIWSWIAAQYSHEENILPCTVLAYGANDRFSDAADVLARYLPDSNVFTSSGGHDWTSWLELWENILSAERLPGPDCARTAEVVIRELGPPATQGVEK